MGSQETGPDGEGVWVKVDTLMRSAVKALKAVDRSGEYKKSSNNNS